MSKYNVLLIGCGHMGHAHLKDIYHRENICIKAVVDLNLDHAKNFAKLYGAESYGTSYDTFLSSPDIDICIIATYTSSHSQIIKDCIKYGKHILCEKPLSTSLEETQSLLREVEQSNSKMLVGYILRHHESYKKIADLIQSGCIGHPIIMRMVQNHHTMNWPRYQALLKDCPPIIDCGVHYFDVMQWVTGETITAVNGIKATTEEDCATYNYAHICTELSNGSVGFYEAGWGNTIASQNMKEFIGPKGRISFITAADRPTHKEEGDLIELYTYPKKKYEQININTTYRPTYAQLLCLINMIEYNTPSWPSYEAIIQSSAAAFASHKSLECGQKIYINENSTI